MHDDLPLFAWQPRRQVLVFPLTRRIGKVRHTASLLASKHGEDANLYWRQVAAANRKHLERIGLNDEEITDQILAFFDAVQSEILRQSFEGHGHGGAA